MDAHTGEHPRIGAVDVIPFVPLGDDDDGRLRRARARRSASGSPTRFELPVYLYAQRGHAARAGQAGRRPARPVRGPQGRDRPARPRARLRPVADAPVGRRGRRRRAAVPDRLQHQPRVAATSSSPSGSPGASASRAAGCPGSRPTASGSRSSGRAQVSMNLLDFTVTPLWLVWETVRDVAAEDGVELAESELIGLAPLAAFLAVADRADAPPEDPVERAAGRRGRATSACATSRRCRPSSCASRPPAPAGPTAMSGGPFRRHRGRPERGADARPPRRRRRRRS